MANAYCPSILVPLDGSPSAKAALKLALRLLRPDGELTVVHAIDRLRIIAECVSPYGGDDGGAAAIEALEDDERAVFAEAEWQARAAGVQCTMIACDGPAAASIVEIARRQKIGGIAMGTHGRRGLARIVLGNTAAGVLHAVGIPTFVVHEGTISPATPFREIAVAIDASIAGRNAARAAVDLAAHDGGSVFFAHVVEGAEAEIELRALSEARAYALTSGVPNDAASLHGDLVAALLIAAEARHADAIAIGAHRQHGAPFALGSLTETIVRTSRVPVFVLPAGTAQPATVAAAGANAGRR